MKTAAAFSVLAASAMALPAAAPAAKSTPSPYFGVMSSRSASPIHLLPLQAKGGMFYLGGSNSAYCPAESVGAATCEQYPGNSTTLAGGQGTLSLGVVVPGGQQVFVHSGGALGYTQAHSVSMPEGSVVDGWSRTARADPNDPLGSLNFKGGLYACPGKEGEAWQVFANLPGLKPLNDKCLGFGAITYNATEAAAWQY